VFSVLATRVILAFDLNLYIPLSRVDENMRRAHMRDAVNKQRFFFRRHLAPLEEGDNGYGQSYEPIHSKQKPTEFVDGETSASRRRAPCAAGGSEENSFEEMTMAEIISGKSDYFPGLVPLIKAYLDMIGADKITMRRVSEYLDLIEKRSKGELQTPAAYIRDFVRNHPAYKNDSVVSEEIAHDLLVRSCEIGEGTTAAVELLGNIEIEPISTVNAFDVQLRFRKMSVGDRNLLIRRYTKRASFAEGGEKEDF